MSRAISVKSLTVLGSLAAFGIALAPVGASAAPLSVRFAPSIGHPVWLDLRDQVRNQQIQGPLPTGVSSDGWHFFDGGNHPHVHVPHKPGHKGGH